jgi:SAM-dependent methyltransferase
VISDRLLSIVRCPDCRGALAADPNALPAGSTDLTCQSCGRRYPAQNGAFLDLRASASFAETTKYVDQGLHTDGRHETVSPPLLSAAIRNDMLRAFLAPAATDRVIDLGCGSGRALVWNQRFGAYQVGIDVSPHFAEEARAGVDLVVGDLRRLPLADDAFTKAFSLDVAEHLSRESLVEMLREAGRVLVPGGALFIYTHVRRNSRLALGLRAINRLAQALDRVGLIALSQERLRKSDHLNPLADIADLQRAATEAGFRVARLRYYTPLVGAVVENIFVRLAEGVLARRAARRLASSGAHDDAEPLRAARIEAKRRIAQRGPAYAVLRALTWLMKLDIVLFSRIRSGPFFALLINEEPLKNRSSRAHEFPPARGERHAHER